jgi:Pyruvate/2-oxoacid:ferredoxin oxidoreductase delta subunit
LSRKVTLVEEEPVWKDEVRCYECFSCINYCPRQALQIESRFSDRSYTDVTGRYHHAAVSYKDIAEQR